MKIKNILLVLLGALVAYLAFYPAPIEPLPMRFPRNELGPAKSLRGISVDYATACEGCEDISFHGGDMYTGAMDGRLLHLPHRTRDRALEILRFEGRPLGLEMVSDSLLWVCVEQEGLARVDPRNGTYEIVVNSFNDTVFQLIDYLDVAARGNVYFTDASDQFSDEDLQYDVLQGKPNGALYRYDVEARKTERLVDDLYFANGVVVDSSERFVLVAETSGFRVRKHWLKGPKAGATEYFIEGLPGWPDGISRGTDGLIYVTLISPRNAMHDFILPRPWTRRLVSKLPKWILPKPVRHNRILALDDTGKVVHHWADDSPEFSSIASVERVGDRLYFGTLTDRGIGSFRVVE